MFIDASSPGSSPGVAAPISSIRLNRVVTDMKPAAVGLSGPRVHEVTHPLLTQQIQMSLENIY